MSTPVNTSSTEIPVEISVVKQKYDELVKKSLLTRSQFEGQLKEKSKVISDLKVKEGKDIDTMIEMDKQIKFLNEILYKRNQSIQTIHMLAPKCATYHCDQRDETSSGIISDEEIDKQKLEAHYSYMAKIQENKQNEFEKYKAFNDRTIDYEILQTKLNETLGLLALKDIEIKEGLKTKAYEISVLNQKHDELVKNSLLTKSQLEGYLKENTKVISDLKVKEDKDIDKMIEMDKQLKFLNEIVYTRNQSIQTIHMLAPKCATYNGRLTFANPRYLKKAQSKKPCLYEIPFDTSDPANRFAPDREEGFRFEHELKMEMHEDFEYVKSLEKEIDELESEKADFSNIYDLLLEELSKQTESVNKEVHNNLLKSFSKLEKHSISLELALQQCKEHMKNNSVCKENGSNVFRKEREQYHEIQDLKAQMQDKNIAISELKKLIENCKGKSVETQCIKPYWLFRQTMLQRIPNHQFRGKYRLLFQILPEMRSFQTKQSVNKTNVSGMGCLNLFTQTNLPQD
ncbi:hypothetical protein Tco_0992781 [Tanacetum coccineum]|uniref:Uncharacterized protein n=1 Tax=Tanacetum coccineum TaxID=301880 RepID=A0ABQ5F4J2_9ASTR